MTQTILTTVGDRKRVIDFELFISVHTHLSEFYRALGLEGDQLDIAIVEELPRRLAQELDSNVNVVPLR